MTLALAPVAVLTRPAGQWQALGAQLEAFGWQVAAWPALQIQTRQAAQLPDPATFDLVMFVSGNAVRHYARQREALGLAGWPVSVPVAVVGPASAAAVRHSFGSAVPLLQPDAAAANHDSEALWQVLHDHPWAARRVLIVRGGDGAEGQGRGWLAERWRAAGAHVTLHSAYHRQPEPWPAQRQQCVRAWQDQARPVVWLWSSGEALQAVARQWGESVLAQCLRGSRCIVTHPRVAAQLEALAQRGGVATQQALPGQPSRRDDALVIQVCLPHDASIVGAFVQ